MRKDLEGAFDLLLILVELVGRSLRSHLNYFITDDEYHNAMTQYIEHVVRSKEAFASQSNISIKVIDLWVAGDDMPSALAKKTSLMMMLDKTAAYLKESKKPKDDVVACDSENIIYHMEMRVTHFGVDDFLDESCISKAEYREFRNLLVEQMGLDGDGFYLDLDKL